MVLNRTIRVFVSSTFRDMQSERDELVKFVFPQLRKLCEQRGVVWGEVDLRWGISDEQKSEGKVLPICLDEIKRCRPYFIGVLGERYGWVPDTISPELIEREPWLAQHFDQSVTELEIMYGVLNNPELTNHAFFYFRDPNYLDTVNQDQKSDYTEEVLSFSQQKLVILKDRIRNSHFPIVENYQTPKEFGQHVLSDFTTLINDLYPDGSQPNQLDQEAATHEFFAFSRAQVYIGGETYYNQLDAHIYSDGQPLVVVGESGSGKSALLANWALHYRQKHPDNLVLMHFIGATPGSTDWISMLKRILMEFKRKFDLKGEIPDQTDALRIIFANWLNIVSARGRVLLVLDALNQLDDNDGAPDLAWLPPHIPENVHIILSTLPGRPLNELNRRGCQILTIEPLQFQECKQLIKEYLALFTKSLDPAPTDRIANAVQCHNPLFLRVLLNELRQFGMHEHLGNQIELYLQSATIPALYELILKRCEQDYERERPGLVRDSMFMLWAARRGLTETELMELLGTDGQPLPHAHWSQLYLSMEQSFINRNGFIGFFHDYLRKAIQNRYLPDVTLQKMAHLRLASYFEAQPVQSSRQVDELPWQIAQAGDWQHLYVLLTDLGFFQAVCNFNFFDVKTYWAQIEAHSPYRLLEAYRNVISYPEQYREHLWYISMLLGDTGHLTEAQILLSFMVEYCRTKNDQDNLQTSLGNLANILVDRDELDRALKLYEEQENICRELGNMDSLQASMSNQALILYLRGNLDEAMTLYKQSEKICYELGNQHGLQTSLGNQANILFSRGDLNGAMKLYKEKERICRGMGDKDGLQGALGNQAILLRDMGDLDGSMALLKEVEIFASELGNQNGLQLCYGNQALILYSRGDLDRAMLLHKEQERICRKLGNKIDLMNSLGNQALIQYSRGDLDEAMALHKEEEHISRELNNQNALQRTLGNQANILFSRADLGGALELRRQQERICRDAGYKCDLQASLGQQALILKTSGDMDLALTLFREQERICQEIGNNDGLRSSFGNQALILFARGDLEKALLLHKQEERLCRELGNSDGLQSSLGNQSLILGSRGDLNGAMTLLIEVERICRETGNKDGIQLSLSNQAHILFSRNDLVGAMTLLNEVASLSRESGNKTLLQNTLGNQALILKTRGDINGAMMLFVDQESSFRETGDRNGQQLALDNQANIFYSRGDLDQALALYLKQEIICREMHIPYSLTTCLINQTMIFARKGQKREASRAVDEAKILALSNDYQPLIIRISSIKNKYEI